jgi:hypothetical protein
LIDPELKTEIKQGFWNRSKINAVSPLKLKGLVNDKILARDQEACQNILNKIVEEKETDELQKAWQAINREKIRMKLIERHEQNIQKEVSAGLRNTYYQSMSDIVSDNVE